jgi:hypothetical protein
VAHLAQRMLGRHARLRRNVREQGALITKFAAHCLPPRLRPWLNHSVPLRGKEFFSRLLVLQLRRDPFAVVRFASHGIVSQAPVCPSEQ